jgi:hypothetical protein
MICAEMGMKSVDKTQKSEEIAPKPNIEFTPQMDGMIGL